MAPPRVKLVTPHGRQSSGALTIPIRTIPDELSHSAIKKEGTACPRWNWSPKAATENAFKALKELIRAGRSPSESLAGWLTDRGSNSAASINLIALDVSTNSAQLATYRPRRRI